MTSQERHISAWHGQQRVTCQHVSAFQTKCTISFGYNCSHQFTYTNVQENIESCQQLRLSTGTGLYGRLAGHSNHGTPSTTIKLVLQKNLLPWWLQMASHNTSSSRIVCIGCHRNALVSVCHTPYVIHKQPCGATAPLARVRFIKKTLGTNTYVYFSQLFHFMKEQLCVSFFVSLTLLHLLMLTELYSFFDRQKMPHLFRNKYKPYWTGHTLSLTSESSLSKWH